MTISRMSPGITALREDRAHWSLDDCAGVLLHGEDVWSWLQGQVTQDVHSGDAMEACWCRRTGHIDAVSQLVRLSPSEALVVTHPSTLDVVLERVQSHVILEDVVSADFPVVAWTTVQGPQADALIAQEFGEPLRNERGTAWRHDRTGLGGWDIAWHKAPTQLQGATLTPEELNQTRVAALRPAWGLDVDVTTLLPEMGPEFVGRNVSYQKGCYLGQEVLMRVYSRGHTNWTWRLARSSGKPVVGAAIEVDGKPAGRVTSAAGDLASVRIRNEFASEGTQLGDLTVLGGPRIPE